MSNATVETRFRFTPFEAERAEANNDRTYANILFVGESNTSRSVLAQGIFTALVAEAGLADSLRCESKVKLLAACCSQGAVDGHSAATACTVLQQRSLGLSGRVAFFL